MYEDLNFFSVYNTLIMNCLRSSYFTFSLFNFLNPMRHDYIFLLILIPLDYKSRLRLKCLQRVWIPTPRVGDRGTRRHVVTLHLRQRRYCPRLCLSMTPIDSSSCNVIVWLWRRRADDSTRRQCVRHDPLLASLRIIYRLYFVQYVLSRKLIKLLFFLV